MAKLEKPRDGNGDPLPHTDWVYTYYVRDAQGNVMATYRLNIEGSGASTEYQMILEEQHLYGSGRIGMKRTGKLLAKYHLTNGYSDGDEADFLKFSRKLGDKEFEMSNHLGNCHGCWVLSNKTLTGHHPERSVSETSGVLAVVTDRKVPIRSGSTNYCAFFLPNVVSYSDYYPFGMQMPDRNDAVNSYRYGFNGMEGDDEVKGAGNSYDFGARMYDSRLGRWMSMDPIVKQIESPYTGLSNNPILYIDPDGRDTLVMHRRVVHNNVGYNNIIYIVTFSIIKDGVETGLNEVMYMGGHSKFSETQLGAQGDNAPQLYYKLRFQKMNKFKDLKRWKNTIYVVNPNNYQIFIHPGQNPEEWRGCYNITCSEPEYDESYDGGGRYFLEDDNGIDYVRNLYEKIASQYELTGDKFLLKTNSNAPPLMRKIEPKKGQQIETKKPEKSTPRIPSSTEESRSNSGREKRKERRSKRNQDKKGK